MRTLNWPSRKTKVVQLFLIRIGLPLCLGGQLGPSKSFVSIPSFKRRSNTNWPQVLPYRRHIDSISQLNEDEKTSFADILGRITRRYDNLFSCSFAYSMGIHQRPVPRRGVNGLDHEENFAHLHLHFEPPLLRSSSVRKFLVGSVQVKFSVLSSNINQQK